jgi:hypothetical protein
MTHLKFAPKDTKMAGHQVGNSFPACSLTM